MMGTRDVRPHPWEAFSMKSVSQFLNSSAPNCETVPPHAKSNKAGSVNNKGNVQKLSTNKRVTLQFPSITKERNEQSPLNKNDDVQSRSAKLNSELRSQATPRQLKLQMTPYNVGESQDPTLIKNKNKTYGPRRNGKSWNPSKTTKRAGKFSSLKKERINWFLSIKNNGEVRNLKNIKQGDEKHSIKW